MIGTSCPSRDDPLKEYSMLFPSKLNTQEFLFVCFDAILICQFVPEYATLAINLSLLQHNTAISNSARSTEKNGFYGRKTLIFASLLKISQIAAFQSR